MVSMVNDADIDYGLRDDTPWQRDTDSILSSTRRRVKDGGWLGRVNGIRLNWCTVIAIAFPLLHASEHDIQQP